MNENSGDSNDQSKEEVLGKKRLHSEQEDDGDAPMIYQTSGDTMNVEVVESDESSQVSDSSSDEEDDDGGEEEEVCNDLAYIADLIGPVVEATSSVQDSESSLVANEEEDSDEESDGEDDENDDGDVAEADDESEDSSDDDESDSEDEEAKKNRKKLIAEMAMMTDEEADNLPSGPPRTKNEVVDEPIIVPPIKRVTLPAEDDANDEFAPGSTIANKTSLALIGEVLYHIPHENTIVVQAYHTSNPLNEKSLLCNRDGLVLGYIHEVFGPITTPFYIVRYKGRHSNTSSTNNNKGQNQPATNGKKKRKNKNKKSQPDDASAASVEDGKDDELESQPVNELDATPEDVEMLVKESEGVQVDVDSASVVEPQVATEQEPRQSIPEEEEEEAAVDYETVFTIGSSVYAVPSHAIFITPGQIMMWKTKGSDASNAYDEEPSDDEIEYSDDEQELLAKQAKNRLKKQQKQQNQPVQSQTFNAELAMQGQSQNRQNAGQRRGNYSSPAASSSSAGQYRGGTGGTYNNRSAPAAVTHHPSYQQQTHSRHYGDTSLIATLAPALRVPHPAHSAPHLQSPYPYMAMPHQPQHVYNAAQTAGYPMGMTNQMATPMMPWMNPGVPTPSALPTYQYQPLMGGALQQQQQQQLAQQQAQAQAQAYYMALMMQQQQQQQQPHNKKK